MSHSSRRRFLIIGIAAIVLIAGVATAWYVLNKGRSYTPSPLTFDGSSDQLQHTVVVPTLDTTIPEGKSAIWCVSFQLAWNRLRDDVAKEPLRLAKVQEIADRLNSADNTEDDVGTDAVYAAAGMSTDGIAEKIRKDMAERFRDAQTPDIRDPQGGAVAYAYLTASAKYRHPFFENDGTFLFTDSAGKETAVGSFGIREKDDYAYEQLREQVQILYRSDKKDQKGTEVSEFIIDPCKTTQPYQIVLARVDRKSTLTETLADVDRKIANADKVRDEDMRRYLYSLNVVDTVLIPNMSWRINHRFKELEGSDKLFANPALQGQHVELAMQTIQFRLDRSGAELSSEFKSYMKPSASFFDFKKPFLVIMKKRGGKRPFFVMWVDNAELLQRK